jgi:hypothetical protein
MPVTSPTPIAVVVTFAVAVVSALVVWLTLTPRAEATALPGRDSPACLRGHWTATVPESRRVLKSMVAGQYDFKAKLYMIFDRTTFSYGTPSFVFHAPGNSLAKGRFFTLHGYTARTGRITLAAGRAHLVFEEFSVAGHSATPPPAQEYGVPGGQTPFQCRGSVLKYKLPRLSGLGWITLHRGGS